MLRSSILLATAIALAASCGFDEGDLGKQGFAEESLKVTNSEGEANLLRAGTSLNVLAGADLELQPNAVYEIVVSNQNTGSQVSRSQLLTDMLGKLELTTVAHDLGEFDDVEEDHTLSVSINTETGAQVASVEIAITPRLADLASHGIQVDEVQPPHVYSAGPDGKPLNSFIVGALPDPGEVAAPVYVAGKGFPGNATQVDIYIVRDRDKWAGQRIPQPGDADYIAGPVVASVDRGLLRPVAVDWTPTGADLSPYDILVDVDRNGTFEYTFSVKDASDGENKVGLTLQYGKAWYRAKSATVAAKLSRDAAEKAYKAADAAAAKAEEIADSPEADALAAQARAAADAAKAQLQLAQAAVTAAETAFNQTLADDTVCQDNADKADAAALLAADKAKLAADLIDDTLQAQKAYEAKMKALAAEMASKHLLVNLAFSSASRSGTWKNSYSQNDKIYSYVNPPVQSGARHAFVTKLVVRHQSWRDFWNNPAKIEKGGKGGHGRIRISSLVVQTTGGTVQHSCTNSPPVAIINPKTVALDAVNLLKYDVVFDYDNDGYYDLGRDFLDVVAHTDTGKVVSAKELEMIDDDKIFGFQIVK